MKFMMQKMGRGFEKKSTAGVAGTTLGGSCPRCGNLYALVGKVHNCVPKDTVVSVVESSGSISSPKVESSGFPVPPAASGARFDRALYQRKYMKEYMKRWRAKKALLTPKER